MCPCAADKTGGARSTGYSAADNRQRLLAEEAELDRVVKELEATLPPSEGELFLTEQTLVICHSYLNFKQHRLHYLIP